MALAEASIVTHNNDGSGTWAELGAQSSSQNTNIFLTSTGSRAKKVSNSTKGFMYQVNATGRDMQAEVACIRWMTTAGVGSLGTRTSGGVSLAVQDTSGNVSYWDVDGNDTYKGGWKITVVDLSTTRSRNNGTNADLSLVQYVGMEWTTTATVGGGDPNCYIDQVLSWPTAGITITGNTTAFIDDLVDSLDSLRGVWERRSGIVFSKGRLIINQDATDISETDRTLVYENPVYDAGATIDSALSEIGMESVNATAGQLQTWTRCDFISADPDETVTTDANREFDYTTADFDTFNTCKLQGFDGTVMHLGGTDNAYSDCTIAGCSQIVDTGAIVRRGFVRDTQTASGALLWTSNISNWEDTEFVMGSTDSNAVEYAGPTDSETWTGFTFSGYGTVEDDADAVIHNSGANTLTIDASDITGSISERNTGGGDVVVNNNVTLTFTNLETNTEVRIYTAGTSTELDGVENSGASFGASVAGSTSVDYVIHKVGFEYIRVESFTWPAANQSIQINQRIDRNDIGTP